MPASAAGPELTTVVMLAPPLSAAFATPTPRKACERARGCCRRCRSPRCRSPVPVAPVPVAPVPVPVPAERTEVRVVAEVGDLVAAESAGPRTRDARGGAGAAVVADGLADEIAAAEDHERSHDREGPPRDHHAPPPPRLRHDGRRGHGRRRHGGRGRDLGRRRHGRGRGLGRRRCRRSAVSAVGVAAAVVSPAATGGASCSLGTVVGSVGSVGSGGVGSAGSWPLPVGVSVIVLLVVRKWDDQDARARTRCPTGR